MNEWQLQTLDSAGIEFIDGDRGKNYPSQDDFLDIGHCLFLSTKNVRPNGFDFDDCQFISAEKDELLRKGKLNRGDIVLTTRGTVGNTALYDETVQFEHVRINSGMVIIRMKPTNVDSSFFLYFLRQLDYTSFVSGSAQPQLPIRDLKQIEIALPPLPEQKAIASVLSSLDDKIDLLHRQNKTLEAMTETLFRQWFIEEAKEDWSEVKVSSLFEVRDGTHDSPKQSPIGYPLVTSKHIGNGVLDFDSCYLISSDDYDKVNARSKVETGDILLSMIGTLGRTYLECNEVNYAIKNIGLFKTSKNPVWKYFIYLWLNSVQGKQFVDEHKSGSTQEYLSLGSLRGIQLKSPPNDVLLSFNAHVDNWFKKIHANTKQIQTLENLRDTLLAKLMSGEVRVQYQTEEVA